MLRCSLPLVASSYQCLTWKVTSAHCFFLCGLLGMFRCRWLDHTVLQVRQLSCAFHRSGERHPATNIITGSAVDSGIDGFSPCVVAPRCSGRHHLGQSAGIVDKATGQPTGGLFGTAWAMGMLSSAVFVLTMDFFGPVRTTPAASSGWASSRRCARSRTC